MQDAQSTLKFNIFRVHSNFIKLPQDCRCMHQYSLIDSTFASKRILLLIAGDGKFPYTMQIENIFFPRCFGHVSYNQKQSSLKTEAFIEKTRALVDFYEIFMMFSTTEALYFDFDLIFHSPIRKLLRKLSTWHESRRLCYWKSPTQMTDYLPSPTSPEMKNWKVSNFSRFKTFFSS